VIKEHTRMADDLAKQMGLPVPSHKGAASNPAGE
jgi:hypothetical protein